MSTTFWAPDAPTRRVCPLPDEPEYEEEVSTLPTLTVAYGNVPAFLALLGLPAQAFDAGAVKPDEMDWLIQRLLWLLNDPATRQPGIRAACDDQTVHVVHAGNIARIRRLARFSDAGLSDERIVRYAQTLLDLLVQARAAGYTVVWA